MLRHMLYPIWIQSVEKYADQQPQQLLASVAEGNDPANFIFCLNKADQIAGKDGSAAVAQIRDDFALRIARTLGLDKPAAVYVVSAKTPGSFDFSALRGAGESEDHGIRARFAATRRATADRTILAWLDAQHLPQRAERISRLREDAGEMVAARIAVPILENALPRLVSDPAYRLSIIDPVVTARMAHWPIVSIVHGLLSPLLMVIRRNLGASAGGDVNVDDYPGGEGSSLATMVQTTFAQLQQSNPTISALYAQNKLWESAASEFAAADLRRRLAETLARQREAAMTAHRPANRILRRDFRAAAHDRRHPVVPDRSADPGDRASAEHHELFARAGAEDRAVAGHDIPAEEPDVFAAVVRRALGDYPGADTSARFEIDRAMAIRSQARSIAELRGADAGMDR